MAVQVTGTVYVNPDNGPVAIEKTIDGTEGPQSGFEVFNLNPKSTSGIVFLYDRREGTIVTWYPESVTAILDGEKFVGTPDTSNGDISSFLLREGQLTLIGPEIRKGLQRSGSNEQGPNFTSLDVVRVPRSPES